MRLALVLLSVSTLVSACERTDEPQRQVEAAVPAAPGEPAEPAPERKTWQQMYDEWTYPAAIPPFELTDHDGRKFLFDRYQGSYVVVGFAFTRCSVPEACPLTMTKMREVQVLWDELEAAGKTGGKELELVTATLDPGIDTPEVFKKWGEKFGVDHKNWALVTGPIKLMEDALPSLFGVMALPDNKGSYSHNVKLGVLKPDLFDLKEWMNNEFEAQDVVDAILADKPAEHVAAG